MSTKTITITDLAEVQPGDIVTADYVPPRRERGARFVGEASQDATGELIVGGYYLRSLRFISATREVPAWEPDAAYVRYLAQALAAPMPETASTDWQAQATHLLTHMRDNGWLKEPTVTVDAVALADPAPIDPVLDENDKGDRIDSDGYKWRWSGHAEVWQLGALTARGNLAALDHHYGPLRFADEETEA